MNDDDDKLHLFCDTNVLINAFVFQHADDAPAELDIDNYTFTGSPSALIMQMIGDGRLINSQQLVLHISQRGVEDMAAKLNSNYRWPEPTTKQAMRMVIRIMQRSGGTCCMKTDQTNIDTTDGVDDREDQHRLAEARFCGAQIFLSDDGDVLGLGNTKPLTMTPRAFVDRARKAA